MIVIVDIGMGNIGSIQSMFQHLGLKTVVSNEPETIQQGSKLILPGVGSFDNAMKALNSSALVPVLDDMVIKEKTPILGICLGMHLLTLRSEEGKLPGLGWIQAETVRFQGGNELRVPHMGWNTVSVKKKSPLFDLNEEEQRFYFVHSYHVRCHDHQDVLTTTNYGIDFTSSMHHENIYGVQYHPEKSHRFGMRLLKRFAEL